jgi:hypothetical protein
MYVCTYHSYHTYIHTDIKCISSDTNNARTSNSSSIGRHTSAASCRETCSVDPCKDVPCKGGALGEKVSEKKSKICMSECVCACVCDVCV